MKKSICIVVLSLAAFAFAIQRGLPSGVAKHVSTLTKAKSFKAKFTVQVVGGTMEEFTVTYGKPDMLRLFTGKAAPGRPAPIPRAAMAGEMSKAMVKYEQLLKSRIAADTRVNRVR